MTKITSDKVVIACETKVIFDFLGDFNNFEELMPDKIVNWKSTDSKCSFTITGMTDLQMIIQKKTPNSQIFIVSDGKVPFNFELICNINDANDNSAEVEFMMNADLNPMLKMMAVRPLTNLLNVMASKLKDFISK